MNELESISLSGSLPAGEHILWRGSPTTRGIALRSFHLRKIALYFAALLLWRFTSTWPDTHSVTQCLVSAGPILLLATGAIGVFALLAWLIARTTTYAITTRRVILQFGVALPMTVNVPFRVIDTASVRRYADDTGDIPLVLTGEDRIAYLVLWPHVRPWQLRRPQPMLRAVPNAALVAKTLADALSAETAGVPVAANADSAPQEVRQPAAQVEHVRYA